MAWNCEQVEARLTDSLDGLLAAGEQAEFAGHTAGCAKCARLVAEVRGVVARMQRLEPLEEPPRLIYQILDRTLGPREEKKGWRAWLGWLQPVTHPRLAMGVATVFLTLAILTQAMGIEWGKVDAAALKPTSLYRAADRRAHLLYARGVKFVNDLRVVYEIQSRLQPEAEPQPAPPAAPEPDEKTAPEKKPARKLNRADELRFIPSALAASTGGGPGRSVR